jgi:hypothetical protein
MMHPHLITELARAHRADLNRAAQAQRLARTAPPRPGTTPGPPLLERWIAVLRRALRRAPRPVSAEEAP